jgi:hypothetical protein
MSTISLRLLESLHNQLRELAKKEGVSINQLAASALGEQVAALMTQDYLEERARRGSREKFESALAKVRDVPPQEGDEL